MIKSMTPVWTALLLLSGSFLILTVPNWVAYTALFLMTTGLTIHMAYKHQHVCRVLWHFCAEFVGFCLLVLLFVMTTVMMSGLISY